MSRNPAMNLDDNSKGDNTSPLEAILTEVLKTLKDISENTAKASENAEAIDKLANGKADSTNKEEGNKGQEDEKESASLETFIQKLQEQFDNFFKNLQSLTNSSEAVKSPMTVKEATSKVNQEDMLGIPGTPQMDSLPASLKAEYGQYNAIQNYQHPEIENIAGKVNQNINDPNQTATYTPVAPATPSQQGNTQPEKDKDKENSGDIAGNFFSSLEKLMKGAGENASGLEAAASSVPMMAEGGYTKATEFTAGEGDADNPNPYTTEKVKIDYENKRAQVISAPQLHAEGKLPGFAKGTNDYPNLEHFASGSPIGAFGQAISSGGTTTNGNEVLGGVGNIATALASLVPGLGEVVMGLELMGHVILDVIEGFNKLTESIAPYSAEISGAIAGVEIKNIQKDVETAQDIGPELAQLYSESNSIWIDIQKILRSIAEPVLEMLVPVIHVLKETMDVLTPIIRTTFDQIGMILTILFNLATDPINYIMNGGLDTYITKKSEEIARHSQIDNNKPPFIEDILSSGMAALGRGFKINTRGVP